MNVADVSAFASTESFASPFPTDPNLRRHRRRRPRPRGDDNKMDADVDEEETDTRRTSCFRSPGIRDDVTGSFSRR